MPHAVQRLPISRGLVGGPREDTFRHRDSLIFKRSVLTKLARPKICFSRAPAAKSKSSSIAWKRRSTSGLACGWVSTWKRFARIARITIGPTSSAAIACAASCAAFAPPAPPQRKRGRPARRTRRVGSRRTSRSGSRRRRPGTAPRRRCPRPRARRAASRCSPRTRTSTRCRRRSGAHVRDQSPSEAVFTMCASALARSAGRNAATVFTMPSTFTDSVYSQSSMV